MRLQERTPPASLTSISLHTTQNTDLCRQIGHVFTLAPRRGGRGYCIWVCLFVCLFVCLSVCLSGAVSRKLLVRFTSNFNTTMGVLRKEESPNKMGIGPSGDGVAHLHKLLRFRKYLVNGAS